MAPPLSSLQRRTAPARQSLHATRAGSTGAALASALGVPLATLLTALVAALLAAPAARAEPAALLATAGALAALPAPSTAQAAAGAARRAGESRFDLAVNDAPAAQVFMQIAQGSTYTMLVSPEVSGRITINLKNTTVLEALEALRDLHNYDFRVTGQRIIVQSNSLQTRMFKISYLPGQRRGTSDVKVSSSSIQANNANGSSSALPQLPGGAGGGNGNRPEDTTHVRTSSDADFWRDVRESLNLLLPPGDQRKVVLNPAAGVILVRALPAELRQIEQYLKAVQVNVERQVMIEAKILEVELSQDAQSGVNWNAFGSLLGRSIGIAVTRPGATLSTGSGSISSDGTVVTQGAGITTSTNGTGFYGLSFQSANFAAMLNFLETQGKVQVLSSPRIATLNNQKAVLKVGSDELYVTNVSSQSSTTGSTTTTAPTVNLQPIFSGIALDVTPQIDSDGMVMLHVHPSITTVTEKQKNINLGALGSYQLPLAAASVNETDSIVRVPDGQIVAIGGLMMQEQRRDRSGVPVLGDLPVVGDLFKQKATVARKRELVILMKPTVIKEDGANWPESTAYRQAEAAAAAEPVEAAPAAR